MRWGEIYIGYNGYIYLSKDWWVLLADVCSRQMVKNIIALCSVKCLLINDVTERGWKSSLVLFFGTPQWESIHIFFVIRIKKSIFQHLSRNDIFFKILDFPSRFIAFYLCKLQRKVGLFVIWFQQIPVKVTCVLFAFFPTS